MAQQRILVVDSNSRRVQALRDNISGVMLSQPIHRGDGESAVLWVGANACDMCIISYELPGIDGLETLARMRNRRPDLPAILIAESQEQHVAVAAFRAGVIDFVSARGSYARIVAERAQEYLDPANKAHQTMTDALEDPTLRDVPPERLTLTYQNRLRAIGRQLDVYQYHTATILEIDGGFIVRAAPPRSRVPEALEFPDRDFPRLVASAYSEAQTGDEKPVHVTDLTPTGYEDLLRALGFRLDQISAESVVITELDDVIVVGGRGSDETKSVPGLVPFKIFLQQAEVEFMLNEAFHRRGKHQPSSGQQNTGTGGLRGILKRLN